MEILGIKKSRSGVEVYIVSLSFATAFVATQHAYNTRSVLFTQGEVASRSDDGEVAVF